MRLTRDSDLFAKDAVFEGTNGPIKFDSTHSYSGSTEGEYDYIFFTLSNFFRPLYNLSNLFLKHL